MGTLSKCDFAVEGALAFKMVSVISDKTLELIREFHLHSHKNHWKQTYLRESIQAGNQTHLCPAES